jgi:nicotinate-nucleotide pyrophosphorylase (carboxylating)
MLSHELRAGIVRALEEDLGSGDVTTWITVPEDIQAEARLVVNEAGIVAGLDVAEAVFRELDPKVDFSPLVPEGSRVAAGQVLAIVSGRARAILSAERTALNFLGRMSGIATLTRRFVDAVAGTRAEILDTRKTAPGLRAFDKQAVRLGGGHNHRFGLYDMILIKDNHIDLAGSLAEAVRRAQAAATGLEIEVEARTLEDVQAGLEAGARRILLDNMSPEMLMEAVNLVRGRARLEASGNVSLGNVRQIAETGVNDISIGALTHSVKVLDISLDFPGPPIPSGVRARSEVGDG